MIECEPRAGRSFRYRLRSADGFEMWGRFAYREMRPAERIVGLVSFTDALGAPARHPLSPTWPREVLETLAFSNEPGETRITLRALAYDATEEEHNTFEAGREALKAGFDQTWDRLEDYLRS